MPTWIQSTLIGLTFGAILNVFYVALRHAWPENYFGLSGSVDPVVSRNAFRYLAFRFIPPFIAVVGASLTAERSGGSPLLGGLMTVGVHTLRLIPAAVRAGRQARKRLCVATCVIGFLLVALGLGAVQARELFVDVIPRPGELVANLWAGFLAAVGAVYLQRVALVRRSPATLVRKSLAELPQFEVQIAVQRARVEGLDEKVLLSILAVENLQRPEWFRKIEYTLPKFLNATTGLLQQKGANNDRQSIDRAIEAIVASAAPRPVPDVHGFTDDHAWRTRIFRAYNSGDEFVTLAHGAFELLDDDPTLVADFLSPAEKAEGEAG